MKQIVLITGCSSGIGYALAERFNQQGFTVVATARRLEALEALGRLGCHIEALDVTEAASREALVSRLCEKYGHIDVLINNAGISAMGPIVEMPEAKLKQQFETNVFAPVLMVQALLPLLRVSKQAVVINVGSISGVLTTPFAGAYCASKAALHSLSEAMRLELAPLGIDVVTLKPGAVQSNFGNAATEGVADWLNEDSLYAPIKEGIMARANASQQHATPALEFAQTVVDSLKTSRKSSLHVGKGSLLYPFVARWVPERVRDLLLIKRFGLHKL